MRAREMEAANAVDLLNASTVCVRLLLRLHALPLWLDQRPWRHWATGSRGASVAHRDCAESVTMMQRNLSREEQGKEEEAQTVSRHQDSLRSRGRRP